MKTPLLFSIIIPVYNVEPYLAQCLDSAVGQTYKHTEIIIVNDGSTDNSYNIARLYKNKYKNITLLSQPNTGLGAARNRGLDAATGDYLCFLDSDDFFERTLLEHVEKVLSEDSTIDLLIFDIYTIFEKKPAVSLLPALCPERWNKDKSIPANNIVCNLPCSWNKVYKRMLFTENSIRFHDNLWYEDIPVTVKMFFYAKRTYYLRQPLYYYRKRKGSITSSSNMKKSMDILDIFDDIHAFFQKVGAYEKYRSELEFLTVLHALLYQSVRIITAGKLFTRDLNRLRQYTETKYPQFSDNPYLPSLHAYEQTQLKLIIKKQYTSLFLLLRIKNMIYGMFPGLSKHIRRILRKG